MPEEKQLSTTSEQSLTVPDSARESLKHCPVALMLYDRVAGDNGIPMEAVSVVAATDMCVTTAAASIRSGAMPVRQFAKDFEERTLSAVILTHLMLAEDIANVSRPMKSEAMAAVAKKVSRMLLDDDMTWNLADIRIVADRLGNGECGPVYGGLSGPMIMKAFMDYMGEKMDAFTDLRNEEAAAFNEQWDRGINTGRYCKEAEIRKHRKAMHDYQLKQMQKDIKTEQP